MADAKMDITIGAEVQGAVNGLKKVQTQLVQTGQQATKFTQKGKTDFTNLNRVIQDLPFGFNAIQNNITQLVPAAGGLGVAFSVITSALTFAQVGLANWTRGLKESKEQTDEFAKAQAKVETEVSQLGALLSVAKDVSQSTATRTEAIKQLQKEYPGYLQNLNLENVNSQETANAIKLLGDALARKAKIQALSNLLTAANEKLLKAQKSTLDDNLLSTKAFLGFFKGGALGLGGTAGLFGGAADELSTTLADTKKEIDGLNTSLTEMTLEQAQNKDFSLLNPTTPKKLKEVAQGFAQINAFIKGRSKFDSVTARENGEFINNEIQKGIDSGPLLQIPAFDFNKTDLAQKVGAAAEIIRQTLEGALEGVGETLGNLLSGKKNPFSNFYNIIGEGLKALGKQLIIVGELAQVVQKALATIFTNPGLAIAVGIAAIAIGTAISNMANKGIKAFATGGVVTQPTLALVGEQGPERITPLGYEGRASNMWNGELTTRISGTDLVILLNRTNRNLNNIN